MTHKKFVLIISIIAVGALLFLFFGSSPQSGTKIAEIYSGGKLIRRIDLSSVTTAYEFTVESDGGFNTVSADSGGIAVTSADCPDLICVHTGKIRDSSAPIVCLPNKLVIKIVGGAGDTPDAVSR